MLPEETSTGIVQTPPPITLMEMATGHFVSQAVYVAAKLRVADLVADGAKTAAELAEATGVNPSALYRLLRMLASRGVFHENAHGGFEQTPVSACLQAAAPGSLRAPVLLWNEEQYRAWGDVLYSIKTGTTAFDHVFGTGWFTYVEQHPEAAAVFNDAMSGWTAQISAAVVQAFDFTPYKHIVDVGGGHGTLLISILKSFPHVRGTIFDTPLVAAGAKRHVDSSGLAARCDVIEGDFFASVPPGADVYMLSQVLHDWDDERCAAILKNCHDSMPDDGRLVAIESVVTPAPKSLAMISDVHMLVVTGGRERTEGQYRDLFASAGFTLTNVVPTRSLASVLEARRT